MTSDPIGSAGMTADGDRESRPIHEFDLKERSSRPFPKLRLSI
jgi:hypothetical protein